MYYPTPTGNSQVSNSLEDFCKRVRAPWRKDWGLVGFCLGRILRLLLLMLEILHQFFVEKIELLIEYQVLTSGPLEKIELLIESHILVLKVVEDFFYSTLLKTFFEWCWLSLPCNQLSFNSSRWFGVYDLWAWVGLAVQEKCGEANAAVPQGIFQEFEVWCN